MLDPGGFFLKGKKPGKLQGSEKLQYQDENYIPRIEEQYGKAGLFNQNLVDQSQSNQSRAMNEQVISQLQDQASGKAPSLAEMLLTKNAALNNQNAAAQIANSSRGNPALAARLVMQNNQANNFGTAQDAASARIQEQQAAQQTLANVINAQRQMDLSQSSTGANVGMNQQSLAQGLFGQNLAALQNRNNQLLAGQQGQQAQYQQDVNRSSAMSGGLLNAAGTVIGGIYGGPAGSAAGGAAGKKAGASQAGAAKGGMIPGYAPGGATDDYSNDTVPTMLSPQEIVIPRSITMGKNAPEKAKAFVEKILEEKSSKKMAEGGKVGSNADRIAELERQIACIPGMKGRKKMADGGPVGPIQDLSQTPGNLSAQISNGGMPSPRDLFAQRNAAAIDALKDPKSSLDEKARAAQSLKEQEVQEAAQAQMKAEEDATAQKLADQKAQEDQQKASLINEMVSKHGGTPVEVPNAVSRGTDIVPASMSAEAAPEAASATPIPTVNAPTDPTASALASYNSAANAKFAGESRLSDLNMAAQSKLIEDLEAKHAAYKVEQDKLQKQSDALYEDVLNQKVDPSHFWASKSTGDKIGSTIAIALSGIGNALSASAGISASNGALSLIERNIDRDIDAQKENINSKNNLYRLNLQRLGDSRAAESATQAQMLTMATAQMSRNAAIVGTDMAKATRDEFLGNAKIKIAELNNQTLKASQESKNAGRDLITPFGNALTSDDAKKVKDAATSYQSLKSSVDQMKALRKEYGAEFLNRDAVNRGKSLASDAQLELKNLAQLGALSGSDIELLQKQIPDDPLGVGFKESQFDAFQKNIEKKLNSIVSTRVPGYVPINSNALDKFKRK